MKKNTKGFVGLISGLLAFVSIVIAFIPTTPVKDSSIKFFGEINIYFSIAAIVLAIVAIVAGVMSRKHADKKGPRKSGVIIGILALILGIITIAATSLLSTLTYYANNPNDKAFSTMSDEDKANLDLAVEKIFRSNNN